MRAIASFARSVTAARCRGRSGRRSGLALLALLLAACQPGSPAPETPSDEPAAAGTPATADGAAPASGPAFEALGEGSGLDFSYRNGRSGALYLGEIMGGGAALLDYDRDGDLDVFFAQGRPLRPKGAASEAGASLLPGGPDPAAPEGDLAWRDRLYRNDGLSDGRLRFSDVTEAAGIVEADYGVGAIAGDYDGDGFTDLYVLNWGPNRLWRNLGDGRFQDVTEQSGAGDARWSAAASFLDYDRDGHLDLFIANYLDFDYGKHHDCFNADGSVDYCGPKAYSAARDRLLRGRGDGTFEDVTEAMGLLAADGPGLAALAADLNDDGWTDLYVANDQEPNLLWLSEEGKRFRSAGVASGLATDAQGRSQASMGISPLDAEGDGDLDLFVTNLKTEYNTLYLAQGGGLFEDRTADQPLGRDTLPYTSFGTCALDLQADGWPDLVTANGAVIFEPEQVAAGDDYPLKQANQLLLNQGDGRFADAASLAGPAFTAPNVGRGLACGDLDEDGDRDLVLVRNEGPPLLLLNRAADGKPWLGLGLVDAAGHEPVGASVTLEDAAGAGQGGRVLAHRDGSYASGHDPRVLIGLGSTAGSTAGAAAGELSVRVRWPDGSEERFAGLAPGRYHGLKQGEGAATGR